MLSESSGSQNSLPREGMIRWRAGIACRVQVTIDTGSNLGRMESASKLSVFEANSRAMKRVEWLKVEVAEKLEGRGENVDPDWSVALDAVAPYIQRCCIRCSWGRNQPRILTWLFYPQNRRTNTNARSRLNRRKIKVALPIVLNWKVRDPIIKRTQHPRIQYIRWFPLACLKLHDSFTAYSSFFLPGILSLQPTFPLDKVFDLSPPYSLL